MKLYYCRGACSLAVRIIIHEIGLTADYESVDLKTKITEKGEDYRQINPKGAVPCLITDEDEVLTENAVILQYLAEKYLAEDLLPHSINIKRFRVLEWLNFIGSDLHKNCAPLFNPKMNEEVKNDIFKPLLKTKLELVDQHLAQKQFLVGENFTLPDAYLFVILFWLASFNIKIADYPNLNRYFENLKKRKTILEALREEGF